MRIAETLEKEGLIKLEAVVIRNPEKYRREVEHFKDRSVKIYRSYEELLEAEKGRIEAVTLPTAIHQHKDMTVKALEHGFNVLVEKPPAATIQDLNEMIEAEKRSGKICAVGFQSQSKTVVRKLKEHICNGKLGEIKAVLVKGKWKRLDSYYERNAWAGKFMHEGKYVLDGTINNPLAHYLMNALYFASREWQKAAFPLKVRAELYRGHRIEGEDTSCLVAEVDGGARVFFFGTLCSPFQSNPTHRIIGTKGIAEWTLKDHAYIKYNNGEVEVIKEDGKNERVEMFRNFARHLRGLDEEINCPLEMTKPFVLAVNGAYESAGKIKQIPDKFIIRKPENNSISTTIIGIEEIIDKAFETQKLYSDLGVEWAYKTQFFPLKNYNKFSLII